MVYRAEFVLKTDRYFKKKIQVLNLFESSPTRHIEYKMIVSAPSYVAILTNSLLALTKLELF